MSARSLLDVMLDRACAVEGCGRPVHCRQLCKSHYERARRGADVAAPMRRSLKGTSPDTRIRLQSVEDPESGCIVWTGTRTHNGYGRIKVDGRAQMAHRVAYELARGPIPEGLELDHLCRNRACVNPDHLEPVSHAVNTLRGDGPSARNARKTHCSKGHALVGGNVFRYRDGRRECKTCRTERQALR